MGEGERLNDPATTPLRYAVLHHTGIADPHFDLLVETFPGSELATWRSPFWPISEPTLLTRLKDHRRIYLDFEGELTGGRGMVRRVAAGTCRIHVSAKAAWIVYFEGAALALVCLNGAVWHASLRAHLRD
jgi:hypothetical protein